jgi:hypothetical protein
VVKKIITAAGLRGEVSFTSFRHGGFTETADSDLTDAERPAARACLPFDDAGQLKIVLEVIARRNIEAVSRESVIRFAW